MKRNAFTLIEVIGIFVVMGLIILVTVPSLTNTIKESKENDYENYKKDLFIAAENYVTVDEDLSLQLNADNKSVFMNTSELILKGYISGDKLNPKTGTKINPNSTIKVTKNIDKSYSYAYYDENITESAYVKDGLVMHFDGHTAPENNLWTDLSGNNVLAKTNALSASNFKGSHLSFEKDSNQMIDIDFSTNYTPAFTFHSVYKINSYVSSFAWITYQDTPANYRIGVGKTNGDVYVKNNTGNQGHYYDSTGYRLVSETIVVLPNSDTVKIYRDGDLVKTLNVTINNNLTSNKIRLGAWNTAHDLELYNFLVYNKELTQEEITHMSNIDKIRFK